MPHEITENYERIRIMNPDEFQEDSLRTHDIGKKGFSKRIAGKLRSTGKWATQSLLISLKESETMKRKLREDAVAMKRRAKGIYMRKGGHAVHTRKRHRYHTSSTTSW